MKSRRLKTRKNTTKKHKRGGKKDCNKTCKRVAIDIVKKSNAYKKISGLFAKIGLKDKYDQKIEETIETDPKSKTIIDFCKKKCKK